MFHANATQANGEREREREREKFVIAAMASVIEEEVSNKQVIFKDY